MVKPELRRTRLMTIRVSPEEWKRITKASNEDDGVRSVSDWLRQAVMEKLGRVEVKKGAREQVQDPKPLPNLGKTDFCGICFEAINEFGARVSMGGGKVAHYHCYYPMKGDSK